jgi:hypothetical protein
MGEKELSVAKLEGSYRELSIKREEILFLNTKYETEMDDIRDTVKEIHQAIVGNEAMGHTGMIKRMNEHDTRLQDVEKFVSDFKVTIAKISAFFGVLGAGVTILIDRLIKWLA